MSLMIQGKFYYMLCDGCGTEFAERVKYSMKDSSERDMLAKVYRARWSREYDEDDMAWDFCPDCKHDELALPEPELLTLEQLQQMVGEPVWSQYTDGSGGSWGLVAISEYGLHVIIDDDTARWNSRHGKDWLAYTHKPHD